MTVRMTVTASGPGGQSRAGLVLITLMSAADLTGHESSPVFETLTFCPSHLSFVLLLCFTAQSINVISA